MAKVLFNRGESADFKDLKKNPDSLYFLEDTHEIYLGENRFGFGEDIIIEITGQGEIVRDITWNKPDKILTIVRGDISTKSIEQLISAALDTFHEELRKEVDATLDAASTNPIQNRAVYAEIKRLESLIPRIYYNTRAGWDAQPDLISQKDTLYVYTEYDDEGSVELKFGDGVTYLIDLPVQEKVIADHLANTSIHVSEEDRYNWDHKVRCYLSESEGENIIFTTH